MNWREIPFIRLLIPLVIGILLAASLEVMMKNIIIELLICCLPLLLLGLKRYTSPTPFSPYFGLFATIFLVLFGYQRYIQFNELSVASHFKHFLTEKNYFLAEVTSIEDNPKRLRLGTRISMMASDSCERHQASGHLLVYLSRDESFNELAIGDYLLIRAQPRLIQPPKNPEAFDAKKYFHLKNFHYQVFLAPSDCKRYPKPARKTIKSFFNNLQLQAVQILQQYIPKQSAFSIAAALILGFRNEITAEVQALYANTGAIHVLAVSGLHLGFIYLGVYWFFLRLFGQKSHGVFLRVSFSIILLWGFALFTGGSASVLRAATMLTFIMVGQSLARFCNIYNSLAVAAFFLLMIKPFFLWEVGFQLSFLAVLGIVFFHPILYPTLYFKNQLLDWLWKLTVVSLGAQIGTFPISLYYFHQFPVMFWLSGWLVVPAAGGILSLGLLLLATSPLSALARIVGLLLCSIIQLINYLLSLIQNLPGSLIEGIWIDSICVGLIYLVLISFGWFLKERKRISLWVGLGLCLALSTYLAWQKWNWEQQQTIVVYHNRAGLNIDFLAGRQIYALTQGEKKLEVTDYHSKNFRASRGGQQLTPITTDSMDYLHFFIQDNYIQFYDIRLALIRELPAGRPPPKPLNIDYLILLGSPQFTLHELKEYYHFQTVVAAASNNWTCVNAWERACRAAEIPFINIKQDGAFVLPQK